MIDCHWLLELAGRRNVTRVCGARGNLEALSTLLLSVILGAVLVAACAHSSRTVRQHSGTTIFKAEAAPTRDHPSAAAGDVGIEEIVTTAQRRKPPTKAGPLVGLSSPAGTPSVAAVPAAADHKSTPGAPLYETGLTHPTVTRQHDEVLAVAVSTRLTKDQLRELVERHLSSRAAPGAPGDAPVDAGGELESEVWYKFKFVLARIECPDFIDCKQAAAQSRSNDPLLWDWSLTAKKWDENQTGNIFVRFYGDQSANGAFEQSIAAMPRLQIAVSVDRDLSYWQATAKGLADLLTQFKSILITLGAIAGILVAWKKKVWRLAKRK